MKKHPLIVGIIFLFIFSSVTPLTFGSNIDTKEQSTYDIDPLRDYYGSYSLEEIPESIRPVISNEEENIEISETVNIINSKDSPEPLNGPPMDLPWPMYCHDVRHTGRSPYSTVDTWDEIWRFRTFGSAGAGPVIDQNGIIYIGSQDMRAVYPNGTLKWSSFNMEGWCVGNAPAIDENGTIYIGTVYGYPSYLYAFYPDGTLKWKYRVGSAHSLFSSPAISDDGAIYFGSGGDYPPTGCIRALYPNKTLKWEYNTNHIVYSSPAIGNDGTVYCGSHDTYLYALYPNNGTLKWRYKTGHWIRTSPCIGDGGTIYAVSLDNYLHAVNPNGTRKWRVDVGAGTSPTIGHDGTIYAGYETLHAINPINGSVKWEFNVGGTMRGGTPCNTIDGTIYVGTSDGGKLIAINPDGTEKWRKWIGTCESAPAIGEDGTVYIGSNNDYLFAFGIGELETDADGPYYGLINEPVQFEGYSRGGYSPHSYLWNFGDTHTSEEQNPLHTYTNPENYIVTLTVTDNELNTAIDTTYAWIQTSNTPPNKPAINGPTSGNAGTSYDYTFSATDPDGSSIYYYVDWGDSSNSGWLGPYDSDETITESHTWSGQGTFTISAKAKDPYNEEGPWSEFSVNMKARNRVTQRLFFNFLQQYPILYQLLQRFLRL